jgi:hypothetical protein
VEFNICNKPTKKTNTGPLRKRTDQFLDGSWWSQVFYIEIAQEERDEEREMYARVCLCVCVCVCFLLPSFYDDVFAPASEIVHSTTTKCFYPRAAYISVLGGESSTLPVTYIHTC